MFEIPAAYKPGKVAEVPTDDGQLQTAPFHEYKSGGAAGRGEGEGEDRVFILCSLENK